MEPAASSTTGEVVQLALPMDGKPAPLEPELHRDYVVMLRAGLDMLNARLLLLLALIFGAAMWGFCVYDPTPWRFTAACGFSGGIFLPLALLYARKG